MEGQRHLLGPRARRPGRLSAAWSYEDPNPAFAPIASYVAVYPAAVDECRVDGEVVRPQPGRFYGGWITDAVVGPFKGGPGSVGW